MMLDHLEIRQNMIATCRRMNAANLNIGSAGNLSVRIEGGLLVTPTGIPYDVMRPEQIVEMDDQGRYYGHYLPSSEWRFHYDILRARPDVNVVLHSHATACAILACCRMDLPAIHYMVGVTGGKMVKCSGYAPFGTQELSEQALAALEDRLACLLGNHGVIALGKTTTAAFNVLQEVEHLARIYIGTLQLGRGVVLGDADMDVVLKRFKSYGQQSVGADLDPDSRVQPPVHCDEERS